MEKTDRALAIKKHCVFIGRFQPLHNGHLEAVKWILNRCEKLSVVIGSLQEYSTNKNPLNFFERKEIIKKTLAYAGIKNYSLCGLPDFKNDAAWAKKLFELVKAGPKEIAIVTLNEWTARAAKGQRVEIIDHPMFFGNLSATQVREKIANGSKWQNLVPKTVRKYLKKSGQDKKIRDLQVPVEEKIIKFIHSKVKEADLKGAVLAVSGGVDSALVASLAKKALGNKALYVFLPFYKKCGFRKNIASLERSLGIRIKRIYLGRIFDSFEKVLPEGRDLTYGNLKPRIRMAVLYYFANLKKLMVLGTTNRSEFEIGYFTKYGDGGVDIEPIADLYKTEVLELAEKLRVPQQILSTVPTAALWSDQTDEKELGMNYFQLDTILKMINIGFSKKDIVTLAGILEKKVEKILARTTKNVHKSVMPAVLELKDK